MKSTRLLTFAILFLITGLFSISISLAFTGPTAGQTPGSGSGMISVDPSGNLGFGTNNLNLGTNFNTPPGGTFSKIFTIASSSTPPGVNLRNIASACGASGCSGYSLYPASYVMDITPWGWLEFYDAQNSARRAFVMNNGYFGVGSSPTNPSALFMVNGGDARFSGNLYSSSSFVGNLSGSISSANVSSGVFGSLQGNGNFAFPASVGIATSSQNGLPQALSVQGNGYFSGLLGVGTASPTEKLYVSGGNIAIEGTINGTGYELFNTNGILRWIARGVNNEVGSNSGFDLDFVSRDDLGNGLADVLTLKRTGNVGIGTITPANLLEIKGSPGGGGNLRLTGTNGNMGFEMVNTAGTTYNWRVGGQNAVYNGFDITPSTAAGGTTYSNPALVILNTGRIGIATTTPNTAGLVVANAVSGAAIDVNSNRIVNVGTPVNTGDAANKSYVDSVVGGGGSTGSFTTLTVTGTSTLATTGGNVGIGTAAPAEKLSLGGGNITLGDASGSSQYIGLLHSSNRYRVNFNGYNAGSYIGIEAGSNEGLKVLNTGNVLIPIGNLGIGTAGPRSKLDVNGGMDLAYAASTLANNASAIRWENGSSITSAFGFVVQNGVWYQGSNDTGNQDFGVRGGTVDGSLGTVNFVVKGNGNVGIATTSPAYKLDVVGGGRFSQPVGVGTPINTGDAATKSYVDSSITNNVSQWTTTSTGVYYNGGNVGIGTTSPGQKLEVNGNALVTKLGIGQLDAANYVLDVGGAARISSNGNVNFNQAAGTATFSRDVYLATVAGNVGIATSSPADKLDVKGNGIFRNNLSADTFYDQGNSGYYIDPAANIMPYSALFAGNVGIGTTAPGAKLDINGTAFIEGSGTFTTTSNALSLYSNDVTAYRIGFDSQGGAVGYIRANVIAGSASNTWGTAIGHSISTTPNTLVTDLFVGASGNVGIGTTSPNNKLQIGSVPSYSGNQFAIGDGTNQFALYVAGTPSFYSNNNFAFLSSGGGTGSVGIGTTGPQSKLDFGTSVANNKIIIGTYMSGNQWTGIGMDTTTAGIRIAGDVSGGIQPLMDVGLYSNDASHNWTSRMIVQGNGNVGIATTSPAYKLDVVGGGRFSQPVGVGTPISASDAATKSYVDSSITGGSGSTVGYWTASSTSIYNSNAGYVGVGITNPSEKFEVAGGSLRIDGQASNFSLGSPGLNLDYSPGGGNIARIYTVPGTSGSSYDLSLGAGASEAIRIKVGGNVGIGVSPTAKLDVNGNVSAPMYYDRDNTNYYIDPAANVMPYSATFAGAVGIGTTAPGSPLEVYSVGTDNTLTTNMYLSAGHGTNRQIALGFGRNDHYNAYQSRIVSNMSSVTTYGSTLQFQTMGTSAGTWNTGLFIDTSGSVGIGTTSPGTILDVVGGYIRARDNASYGAAFMQGANGVSYFGNTGTSRIAIGNSTNYERVTILDNGNVGIGTTGPVNALEVKGANGSPSLSADTNGIFTIHNGTTNETLQFGSLSANPYSSWIQAKDSNNIGNSYPISLNPLGGNVGIGTSTPAGRLDVANGNIVNVGAPINANDAATKNYVDSAVSGGSGPWTLSGSNVYTTNMGYSVGIGTASPWAKLDISSADASTGLAGGTFLRVVNTNQSTSTKAGIGFTAEPSKGSALSLIWSQVTNAGNGASTLNFSTYDGGVWHDPAMTISGGSVGIGTTSPGTNLDVNGNAEAQMYYDRDNTNYYIDPAGNVMNPAVNVGGPIKTSYTNGGIGPSSAHLVLENPAGSQTEQYFTFGGVQKSSIRVDSAGNMVLNAASGNLYLNNDFGGNASIWSGNTNTITLLNNGNVGIGTVSPSGKLQVGTYGTISAPTYGVGNGDGLIFDFFNVGNPYTRFGRIVSSAGDASEARLSFFTKDSSANPTEKVTILGNGNVGIGTTSPATTLHVDAAGGGIIRVTRLGSGAGFIQLEADGTNGTLTTTNATIFQTGGSERMRILSTGNVGIGTTGPSFTGSAITSPIGIELSNTAPEFRITRTGGGARSYGLEVDSNGAFYINDDSAGATAQRISILTSGNVGIGTAGPDAKLTISGDYYSPLVVKGNCTGAVTVDWSAGNSQHCVLTGNTTFTFTNGKTGGNYRLILKQGGTGSYTATWPASVRWGSGAVPTLTTTVGKSDYVGFLYNGVDATYDGIAFNANF